jgi:uncharacterized protein (DUF983 family)
MPPDGTTSAHRFAAPLSDTGLRSQPSVLIGLQRGISRTCPACGRGRLFCGYLTVRPVCTVCGNNNEQYPSDDFAPYVTISLVLHALVPALFLVDRAWGASSVLETAVAVPVFLLATTALLPFAKGAVIGFSWAVGVTRNPQPNPAK